MFSPLRRRVGRRLELVDHLAIQVPEILSHLRPQVVFHLGPNPVSQCDCAGDECSRLLVRDITSLPAPKQHAPFVPARGRTTFINRAASGFDRPARLWERRCPIRETRTGCFQHEPVSFVHRDVLKYRPVAAQTAFKAKVGVPSVRPRRIQSSDAAFLSRRPPRPECTPHRVPIHPAARGQPRYGA